MAVTCRLNDGNSRGKVLNVLDTALFGVVAMMDPETDIDAGIDPVREQPFIVSFVDLQRAAV